MALVSVVTVAALVPLVRPVAGRYMIGYTFDQNETAMLLIMMIPWALFLVMTEKGRGRWIGLIAVPAYMLCVFKTGSRGGMLGLGALIPFLIYLSPPKRRAPFILAIVLGSAVLFAFQRDYLTRRFRNVFSGTDYNQTTEDGRIEVWKRGLSYVASRPLQGLGIEGFGVQELKTKSNKGYGIRMTAAHNMYVQLGAELGVIGFFFFLRMFFTSWVGCGRVKKEAQQLLASRDSPAAFREVVMANMARASILGVMVTGFFLSVAYSAITYFSIGAALGVILGAGQWSTGGGPRPAQPVAQSRRPMMRGWRSARSARAYAIDASNQSAR
jgi:O-antigen ligase